MKQNDCAEAEGDQALHEYLKDIFCEACKGRFCMDETGCYDTCEAYQKERAEIFAEWAEEARG